MRRQKKIVVRPRFVIDRKAIAAMMSLVCGAVVAFLPHDTMVWSLAIGLQGGLNGYLGLNKKES